MVDRTRGNEMTAPNYYMASFSRKKDSLEQWRAYGNFCIGFDAGKLAIIRRKIFLYECLYTEDELRKWILEKERIPEWTSLPDEEQRNNAAYNLVYVASMKYKNKHFSTEEEIRLVATSHHNWQFTELPECMKTIFRSISDLTPYTASPSPTSNSSSSAKATIARKERKKLKRR